MPATARRTREKQQRYDDIVAAAETIFFSKGYAQCSMDEIARQAQLSRALLYVYFKDKAAIMHAVMLKAARDCLTRFEVAAATAATGAEQISSIGHAYFNFSVEESDYFDVMTDMNTFPMPEADDPILADMEQCRHGVHELMVGALRTGIEDGSINPEHVQDPDLTARILRGSLHGVIMFTRQPKHPDDVPDDVAMVNEAIDMMCFAMRTEAGS